ncbi:hypothetical protein ALQ24_200018 [Pseudomonas syringae pv. antirrhini]|nr:MULTISPECIES: phospholipase D family protein [Pseudomonas]RMP38551.1 hypothetical protein ALQ24_200018 [Pseudomonas syringae pv. antirrhini]
MDSKWPFLNTLGFAFLFGIAMPFAAADQATQPESILATADGARRIEVGFSPEGTARELVLRTIQSATSSVRLSAYMFTSPDVVKALIAAKTRGVDVAVVADQRGNLEGNAARAGRHALSLLYKAGIPTRTVGTYPIHHDKFIVVDGKAVETGSFNYTAAAAKSNSENALVVWNDPDLAEQYLSHWQSRWDQGQAFKPQY